MRLALPTLLLIAMACAARAQPTVLAEVKTDSGPVVDAEVTVGANHANTSEDGVAVLPAKLGTVEITVAKDGFLPVHTSLQVDSDREWRVEVELKPQEEHEEEITVYATRTNERLQDSPVHVEVLSSDEINEELAMRPGDISMMLNEMAGMRVQTTSPALGAASVRMQGMRGRYTAFLSDGLPLFGQEGAGLGLLQIPPMDLAQVEVIKGNASALYGSAAMGGVVNLISRHPTKQPIHEFLINRSSRGATDGSAFLGAQLTPHSGVTLLGGGFGQDERDLNADTWADIAGYTRGLLRPRFFWDNQKGGTAVLTGGILYENRIGGTTPGASLPVTGQPYIESLLSRRFDIGGHAQWVLGPRAVLAARLSASDANGRHQFGKDVEKDGHALLFGEVSVRSSAGKHTWVAGLATTRDAFRPHDVPKFTYTYVVPGIFGQDDIEISSWLTLSGSARLDFHNQYGTLFSPRISALIRKSGWTSHVSAGQGFFASTPLTEETEAAGLKRLSLPTPLRRERGRNGSLDITRALGPLSVTSTFFASDVDRPVFVDRGATYEIFNLAGPTRNRGVELLGTLRKEPFTATATYSYVRTSEPEPVAGRVDVPLTPRQNFGVVGMWEREGTTRVGLELYYTGKQRLEYNPYRGESIPYVLMGAMGEQKVNSHMKLFLNLENLTNVRQTRWDPLLLPFRESDGRWTVDAWAPLDGRVINGGARFAF
jgi:iron complex outermembrane receptor protein